MTQYFRHWHRHRHGFGFPFLPLFLFFAFANGALFVGAVMAALSLVLFVATAVLVVRSVAIPVVQSIIASLADLPAAPRLARRRAPVPAPRPAPAFPSVASGPATYRQQLLDILKERFVRGELTIAEFEERAAQVVRDPTVRHLG